jgi:hypothetical protein
MALFWFTHEQNLSWWLQYFSVETEGKVVEKREKGGSRGSRLYYVKYRYYVRGNPAPFFREQEISRETYATVFKDYSVTVEYYPANPNLARLSGQFADNSAYSSARFAGCFVMLLGYFIIYPLLLFGERFYQEDRAIRLLLRDGRELDARIVKAENPAKNLYILVYDFNAKVQTITVKQQVSHAVYKNLNEGFTVKIDYLPANPGTARLVALHEYRAIYRQLAVSTIMSMFLPIAYFAFMFWILRPR